ncbi:MAG: hypothetical protein Q8O25_11510 [Sulfurisoma sp.]|nr:hypothetical protein [Sulfurisoma sp.]
MKPQPETLSGATPKRTRLGREDPILQELWAVKAALNAEAGYSIEKLVERANNFDLEATIARLRKQVGT